MTKFDPVRVREILNARQARFDRQGMEYGMMELQAPTQAERLYWKDLKNEMFSNADAIDPILCYLDGRIWDEMTEEERIWNMMKDWEPSYGPGMVRDVLDAQEAVRSGLWFWIR